MNVTWIGSPNYWAGRTQEVRELLLHYMVGTMASADATFQANVGTDRATSAHRGYEDDNRHDYVRHEDTAWASRQANPFTLNWELSADPARPPSDTTYRNVINDAAIELKERGWGREVSRINGHNKYVATKCPGTVDLDRVRRGVLAVLDGGIIPTPIASPSKPALPQPVANQSTGGSLHLPANATSWRVYPESGPYTVGNEVGRLNPSLFGGITYDILGNPTANVYIVKTSDFGRVAVYAGAETGATVAATNQGITMGSGGGKTVYIPAVPTWRVYNPSGPYTVGREIGYLAPARFGGLAYAVVSQPATNVAVIQTATFGRVAIYVGSDSGAQIK